MIVITIPGEPVAAVRMTRWDKWKPAAKKYLAWMEGAKTCALGNKIPRIPALVTITAYMTIPKSRTSGKGKVVEGEPHTIERKDLDNIIKAVMDSLWSSDNGGDGGVWNLKAQKYWADAPNARVVVEIVDNGMRCP